MRIPICNTILLLALIEFSGCSKVQESSFVQDVSGKHCPDTNAIWLTHEHILVDFIGADSIQPDSWNHDSIMKEVLPYLEELKKYKVDYFVDATPKYLGRDVLLFKKIADKTGIRIITNTGYYGAFDNKYVPRSAMGMTVEDLAEIWIGEYENGIKDTGIKPGFIKISIDNNDTLSTIHHKLVEAAAITHLRTGLTIASHTGQAEGLWPQLTILEEKGVSPEALIWVHAQAEKNIENYLKAAEMGCWISLDGLGWELENHTEKLLYAKDNGILDRVLISHDAGWYDPQKGEQSIRPFTNIFEKLYPELMTKGFTDADFKLLISTNPSKAFSIGIRKLQAEGD